MPRTPTDTRARVEDHGQTLPLVALLIALIAATGLLLAALGAVVIDRNRAKHGADAAALAGAVEGEPAARTVAAANGARLESFRVVGGGVVEVTVVVGRARATSRAEPIVRPVSPDNDP